MDPKDDDRAHEIVLRPYEPGCSLRSRTVEKLTRLGPKIRNVIGSVDRSTMSLVVPEAHVQFQHILRLLNTNVDGKRKIMVSLVVD